MPGARSCNAHISRGRSRRIARERQRRGCRSPPWRTATRTSRTRCGRCSPGCPARQRAVLVLRYYADLRDRDRGRWAPPGTVRSLAARAFAALREHPAFCRGGSRETDSELEATAACDPRRAGGDGDPRTRMALADVAADGAQAGAPRGALARSPRRGGRSRRSRRIGRRHRARFGGGHVRRPRIAEQQAHEQQPDDYLAPTPPTVPLACRAALPGQWRQAVPTPGRRRRYDRDANVSDARRRHPGRPRSGPLPGVRARRRSRRARAGAPGRLPGCRTRPMNVAAAYESGHWLVLGLGPSARPARGSIPGTSSLGLRRIVVIDLESGARRPIASIPRRGHGYQPTITTMTVLNGRIYWDQEPHYGGGHRHGERIRPRDRQQDGRVPRADRLSGRRARPASVGADRTATASMSPCRSPRRCRQRLIRRHARRWPPTEPLGRG